MYHGALLGVAVRTNRSWRIDWEDAIVLLEGRSHFVVCLGILRGIASFSYYRTSLFEIFGAIISV